MISTLIKTTGTIITVVVLIFLFASGDYSVKNDRAWHYLSEHEIESVTVGSCPEIKTAPYDVCHVAAVNCGTTEETCTGDHRSICTSVSGWVEASCEGDDFKGEISTKPCYWTNNNYQYGTCNWNSENSVCVWYVLETRPCPGQYSYAKPLQC